MEEMRFHWEKGGSAGSFTVTADSDDDCIRIAEKEIELARAELVDYYSV